MFIKYASLYKLSRIFEVNTLKTSFPHTFPTQNNLFYRGVIPSIDHLKDITIKQYRSIYSMDWSFKDENIKYLKNDLNSLFEVITKVNKQTFIDYDVNITDRLTISGIALMIFLSKYYHNNIPNINKTSIYRDIKQAYYGGITEVYKPYGENLYYYDVNSLYPYVALQDMPGLKSNKEYFYNKNIALNNLFGFYFCEINAPLDSYLSLLPKRNRDGIYFPVGLWKGWYFSEQLKFAEINGYKIKVIKGYSFSRQSNVFKDYINKVYDIKNNPINATQKSMAKSLLNNLLGRFGIRLEKSVTKIITESIFDKISIMNKVVSYKYLDDNKILVSYIPKLDADIISSHNLDIIKLANKYKQDENITFDGTSVAISAAVTSYGTIHISKIKKYKLNNGGDIFYSDTDSIVTNLKLPAEMVDSKELGKLKLEHQIKKAIFITGKTYCFVTQQSQFINKAKGIKSSSIYYHEYLSLIDNVDVKTSLKTQSKIDWTKGFVKIVENKVTLNSNSYKKRIKIYKENRWVDTSPICINEINTSIILYTPKCLELINLEHTNNIVDKVDFKDKNNSDKNNSKKDFITFIVFSGCIILYLLSKLSHEVDEQEESYNNDAQKVNSKDLE